MENVWQGKFKGRFLFFIFKDEIKGIKKQHNKAEGKHICQKKMFKESLEEGGGSGR